ncbi:hypothetical protein T492DRAFT_915765 [Pavlovales sp. CCMP2436]|nr:hypothetical protein T492DRAFT_915765 [Pavlovales sp. CCMP2436]
MPVAFNTTLPAGAKRGEDLQFTWERVKTTRTASVEKPYQQQGDESFDEPHVVAQRLALRRDKRVLRELDRFWRAYKKDADGRVSKAEYLRVHSKWCAVLIPDLTLEEAGAAGEEDWLSDAVGLPALGAEQLANALFQLADLWCSGVGGEEYASFLYKLFRRVTVRTVTDAAGRATVFPPKAPAVDRLGSYRTFVTMRATKLSATAPPMMLGLRMLAAIDAAAAAAAAAAPETAPAGDDEPAAEAPVPEVLAVEMPAAKGVPAGAPGAADASEAAGGGEATAALEAPPPPMPLTETEEEVEAEWQQLLALEEGAEEDQPTLRASALVSVSFAFAEDAQLFPLALYDTHEPNWQAVDASSDASSFAAYANAPAPELGAEHAPAPPGLGRQPSALSRQESSMRLRTAMGTTATASSRADGAEPEADEQDDDEPQVFASAPKRPLPPIPERASDFVDHELGSSAEASPRAALGQADGAVSGALATTGALADETQSTVGKEAADPPVPAPLCVLVTGKPGTGTRMLGKALAHKLHAVYLSADDVRASLLEALEVPAADEADEGAAEAAGGEGEGEGGEGGEGDAPAAEPAPPPPPVELSEEAFLEGMQHWLRNAEPWRRGVVLDGFPRSAADTELMRAWHLPPPSHVLELGATDTDVLEMSRARRFDPEQKKDFLQLSNGEVVVDALPGAMEVLTNEDGEPDEPDAGVVTDAEVLGRLSLPEDFEEGLERVARELAEATALRAQGEITPRGLLQVS